MDDKELVGRPLESAFPSHGTMGEVVETGMALRDYFAAKAPAPIGFPRKSEWKEWIDEHAPDSNGNTRTVRRGYVDEDGAEYLARWAYHYADAMLKARDNG